MRKKYFIKVTSCFSSVTGHVGSHLQSQETHQWLLFLHESIQWFKQGKILPSLIQYMIDNVQMTKNGGPLYINEHLQEIYGHKH